MQFNYGFSSEKLTGITPVSFGYEDCERNHGYGPAVRTHWLIHFVVSGSGIFIKDGKKHALSAGEMFVIPPYVETYYEADGEKPWSYIWIGFTASGELPVPLGDVIKKPEATEIFEDMKKNIKTEPQKKFYLCARIWDLFALLMKAQKIEEDYVDTALGIIRAEYMFEIGAEELARRLSLNRSYFSSIFKKKVGVPPGKYLYSYRMSLAASLLSRGGSSVTVTARSVGYTDIYNFSKMFKRFYGVSPTEYARSHAT